MPRRPRNRQQAVCYHVYNRGWDRGTLFHDDADFDHFVRTAARYKAAHAAAVFHWALMGNHYHLLIRVPFAGLRPFVAGVQQSYAQYHHRRHGSCGVIWQGRFHSKPVEADECLTRCGRYVERNPVRAMLVRRASQWAWSSARYYVLGEPDGLSDADPRFGPAGGGSSDAERRAYERLLEDDADDRWMAGQTGAAVGSDAFRSKFTWVSGRPRLRRGPAVAGATVAAP